MRIIVYSKPQGVFPLIHAGLCGMDHKAIWRNPAPFKENETEPCDLVIVNARAATAGEVRSAYTAKEKPVLAVLDGDAPAVDLVHAEDPGDAVRDIKDWLTKLVVPIVAPEQDSLNLGAEHHEEPPRHGRRGR